jgi:hypothetical protein
MKVLTTKQYLKYFLFHALLANQKKVVFLEDYKTRHLIMLKEFSNPKLVSNRK